jgi:hypothetical protein
LDPIQILFWDDRAARYKATYHLIKQTNRKPLSIPLNEDGDVTPSRVLQLVWKCWSGVYIVLVYKFTLEQMFGVVHALFEQLNKQSNAHHQTVFEAK